MNVQSAISQMSIRKKVLKLENNTLLNKHFVAFGDLIQQLIANRENF